MKKILPLLCFAFAAMVSCSVKDAQDTPDSALRFQDGRFKIAQFTDIHWGNESSDTLANRLMMEKVVAEEQPQLIVLTGDNVTSAESLEEAKSHWKRLIGILERTGVPYALLMGNHDAESCDEIDAEILEEWICELAPHCINYPSTVNCFGHGNKALEILGEHDSTVAAVAYVIDSNDYPRDPELARHSLYDWIHRDQIAWYESESEKYCARNGGQPLPSLAFFHICVPEYEIVAHDEHLFGHFLEPTCPAGVNTGFFASAFMHKDIMGMFVGHDHTNDFCGIHNGIALCYGRQSGAEGMDKDTPIGARIIELREGRRAFDTWVRTAAGKESVWYYPLGVSSDMEKKFAPAVSLGEVRNGVNYVYYEGSNEKSTARMLVKKNRKDSGVMANFDITGAPAEDHFGYAFDTYFMAEESGVHGFRLSSDDGAVLLVDGKVLIDNDGSHSSANRIGFVALEKGLHRLQLNYFEDYMGQHLAITVMSRNIVEQTIPDSLLFIPE